MANKLKNKERVIFDSSYDVDDWRESFKYFCEINGLNEEEEDIYNYIEESKREELHDEKRNLDITIDGDILVIADLGLWDGRHSAYKIIHATSLKNIFSVAKNYDDVRFYCDQYNVKADLYHHDGCNHVEFRLMKNGRSGKTLLDKLYNQEKYTRDDIRNCSTSLRKYVAKVYGW